MKKYLNPWLTIYPQFILKLFILLNIIAIFCYPGGTYINHSTLGYSITQNFLSDLGRTISFSGEINFLSSQLFNMSLIMAGTIFIFFYVNLRKIFKSNNQKTVAFIGSIFGILGGFSLIGVGLTPSNLYLDLHIIFATWLFRFFLISSISYSFIIFIDKIFPNKYAGGYLFFTLSILLYILISELGPNPKTDLFSLSIQVISQKLILIIFLFAVYLQTIGIQILQSNE
jgi:hypothetical membrane protein